MTLIIYLSIGRSISHIASFCDPIPLAEFPFSMTLGYFIWDLTIIIRCWGTLEHPGWIPHCISALSLFNQRK